MNRIKALVLLLVLSVLVALRWFLFSRGYLYGDTQAQLASIAVAGFVVGFGYMALWFLRGSGGGGNQDSSLSILAAILGLAVAGYSIGQLLAPNTPHEASVAACAGVPVNGAKYLAITTGVGANARSGPMAEYQELHHYPADCTLGFDGYCVGEPETDPAFSTIPDVRWLIVHGHPDQLVTAAYVLTESAESELGQTPSPGCASLGGYPQPDTIAHFTYDPASGQLNAQAPSAVTVGYGAITYNTRSPHWQGAMSTTAPNFGVSLPSSDVTDLVTGANGQVILAAAVCLAIDAPVVQSLRAEQIIIRHSQLVSIKPYTRIDHRYASKLAQFACDRG